MIVPKQVFSGIFLSISCLISSANSNFSVSLTNDKEAFQYCVQTPNTYIVVVWPLGSNSLQYIINTLNRYGSVKYVKSHSFNKPGMFQLYRDLHRSFSDKIAKKYFKSYVRSSWDDNKQLPIFSIVFNTDKSFKEILKLKKEIRSRIGESYYSIHINDKWNPETLEAAALVLKN